nr:MAG TPA: hypothetical protein [Caudoviricetes sp.]
MSPYKYFPLSYNYLVEFTIILLYDRVRQSTIQNVYSKSTIMSII